MANKTEYEKGASDMLLGLLASSRPYGFKFVVDPNLRSVRENARQLIETALPNVSDECKNNLLSIVINCLWEAPRKTNWLGNEVDHPKHYFDQFTNFDKDINETYGAVRTEIKVLENVHYQEK